MRRGSGSGDVRGELSSDLREPCLEGLYRLMLLDDPPRKHLYSLLQVGNVGHRARMGQGIFYVVHAPKEVPFVSLVWSFLTPFSCGTRSLARDGWVFDVWPR